MNQDPTDLRIGLEKRGQHREHATATQQAKRTKLILKTSRDALNRTNPRLFWDVDKDAPREQTAKLHAMVNGD